jgi:hypothetical protein
LEDGGGRLADPDIRHKVYSALLNCLHLFGQHEAALKARGLKDGLRAAGYRSLPKQGRAKAVRKLIEHGLEEYFPNVPGLFVAEMEGRRYWTIGGLSGLIIPIRDVQGRIIALMVRPDEQGEGGKYRWLSSRLPRKGRNGPSPGTPIHVPLCRSRADKTLVRVTEGPLKADVATRLSGVLTVGLPSAGIWTRLPPLLQELGAETVRIALDADASRNKAVGQALYELTRTILDRKYHVELEQWDETKGKGIDDLLAGAHEPDLVQGDKVLIVAQGIAELAGAFNRPGSSPPDGPGAPGECPLPAVDIIRDYLQLHYRPTFRRGPVLYSDALAREIRASEACYAPSTNLVNDLEMASDCPRSEKGVNRSAIPNLFKTWAPVAWRDILDQLPEEEATPEVVGPASDEFRAKVAAGLHTHITLGHTTKDDKGTVTEAERRSIINWATLFAKPGPWKSIRNYLIWCRLDQTEDGRTVLRIALRVGLFASGQAHLRSLAEMGQYRFAQLCELYGVGTAKDAAGNGLRACGQRVVELTPEFIEELLAGPESPKAEPKSEPAPCREPGEEG